jgi:hypothetical protein
MLRGCDKITVKDYDNIEDAMRIVDDYFNTNLSP